MIWRRRSNEAGKKVCFLQTTTSFTIDLVQLLLLYLTVKKQLSYKEKHPVYMNTLTYGHELLLQMNRTTLKWKRQNKDQLRKFFAPPHWACLGTWEGCPQHASSKRYSGCSSDFLGGPRTSWRDFYIPGCREVAGSPRRSCRKLVKGQYFPSCSWQQHHIVPL